MTREVPAKEAQIEQLEKKRNLRGVYSNSQFHICLCHELFEAMSLISPKLAKPMLGRCQELVQHPNQPRPMAAEAADEDDEEARAFHHHTHPPGYRG